MSRLKGILSILIIVTVLVSASYANAGEGDGKDDVLDSDTEEARTTEDGDSGESFGSADAAGAVEGHIATALDQYSNLQLHNAKDALEEAKSYRADIDRSLLARVYVAFSIVWIGGYAEEGKREGKKNFQIGLCLDENVQVDPMFSSPDIDTVFVWAKENHDPSQCPSLLKGVIEVAPEDGVVHPTNLPRCGVHGGIFKQKAKHEVPIVVQNDPVHGVSPDRVIVRYAFDGSSHYNDLKLKQLSDGYGAKISCIEELITEANPKTISYYIEGYDDLGEKKCGHGSAEGPYVVEMASDAELVDGPGELEKPKLCEKCPAWDKFCQVLPGLGASCDSLAGCADGYTCSEEQTCIEEGTSLPTGGPARFYVNLGIGTGFGLMGKDMTYTDVNPDTREVFVFPTSPKGAAWSGIPLRLVLGFQVNEKISIEVGVRFDVKVDVNKKHRNCGDVYGSLDNADGAWGDECVDANTLAQEASDPNVPDLHDGAALVSKDTQVAWLVNARVRYAFIKKEKLSFSCFGGLGFGKIKYRVASEANSTFFPMPSGFNIEVGPGFAYYFNEHFGLIAELPIDVVVGDGWAINFDLNAGLSVRF